MSENQWPIVGMFYRPPAKALLEILPQGTALTLRPEPTNPYDSNAVMVILRSADIPEKAHEVLRGTLPNYGHTIEDVLAQSEWHLGYVPRTSAVFLAPELGGAAASAELTYAADGAPQVRRRASGIC